MMTQPEIGSVAGITTAAGLAAGAWFYAALYPRSQIFGRVIVSGSDPAELALTYDDGPNPAATPRLLDLLAKHDVRATFFLIGEFVRREPALAREIAAAGHVIGNHTMTHPWLAWQTASRIRSEMAGASAAIEDAIGLPVTLFRPPHGARRPVVLRVARELGLSTIQWNIITHDWRVQPGEAIAGKVRAGIRRNQARGRGSNILLHDGGMDQPRIPTIDATGTIIAEARASGRRFVTADAWV